MSLQNNPIIEQIGIDKNHIEEFILDTNDGTRRTKEKFHKNAVEQRNIYVNRENVLFDKYRIMIENEMIERVKMLMPKDKTAEYDTELEKVSNLLDIVKLSSDIPNGFKLKFDYIISSINENASLEELNKAISDYISKFNEVGVKLTIDDFKYTMFTENYMKTFLESNDVNLLKDSFEKIFFACPDIKLQLKMNLIYLLDKYNKIINEYVIKLRDNKYLEYQVNSTNIVDKYTEVRNEVGSRIARDEYYNASIFTEGKKKISDYLEDAPARVKNYNTFAIGEDYNSLDENAKNNYNSAVMGFYLTLNELKKYYNYEFIIKDLLERYKNKDSVKNQYSTKKKEIDKEEKKRESIYKEYLKSCGIGFLAKKNDVKMRDSMLKINEQIKKLNDLYEEYRDLEVTYNLSLLNDSASIYDLLLSALKSFSFLEKSFNSTEELQEVGLIENINEYFRFLYNPNNNILRKINVFADYNITSIVADKYKLLNLKIDNEMIDKDNIDSTMDTVKFINLIQNIEKSNISLHDIDVLCQMKEIIKDTEEVNEDDVI